MKLKSLIFFLALVFSLQGLAQQPKKLNSSEIYQSIQKLNFLGSVLYVAAHPDDENTRLISYLSNHEHARTRYLSLTRGDGGQNLIGPEIGPLMGVIRTNELLQARSIDGGEQFFTRANDFGYSKHPDETLEIWDKEAVLADVVWAIRKYQPDIIINRFDHRSPGTTHGHHTASAMLSVEAFDLVGDAKKYGDQLKHVKPWQPKRIFFNTSWWFYGSREKFAEADKSNLMSFDIGAYDPNSGLSNTEIAASARSMHKCQGFGNTGTRGTSEEYVELIKGKMPLDKTNIFEGVNTTWSRLKGGEAIGKILKKVEADYKFRNPAASIPALLQAYELMEKLNESNWKTQKIKELKGIIAACAGLYLEAAVGESYATPDSKIDLRIEAINRSSVEMLIDRVVVDASKQEIGEAIKLKNNERVNLEASVSLSADKPFTTPFWLEEKGSRGMYKVKDQKLIGEPLMPISNSLTFYMEIEGVKISFTKAIIYKRNDPVDGEVYRPFEIIPAASVQLEENVIIFSDEKPKEIVVHVKSAKEALKGTLALQVPKGWKVSPATAPVSIVPKGGELLVTFSVSPPSGQSEGEIVPIVTSNGKKYNKSVLNIEYDHIPYQTVLMPAAGRIVKLDVKKKGETVGYIEGAGDVIPSSLEQMGYKVTIIAPEDVTTESLAGFDAVVIGIRAYNTVEALKHKQASILEYVKNGGTLIIQYNTSRGIKVDNLSPYPMKLSRDRVTDEYAEVSLLAPDHPVLNTPNKITQKDFEGWVQERGLYFPNEWDKAFTPILSAHDKGETPKNGGLLVAPYGKGYYIYTGYSWFRQFPAGVPGAYRIFANMVSIGK